MTTYRPGGVRLVALGIAISILVVAYAIGVALPDNIVFTPMQVGTLLVIYGAILVGLYGISRSFVRASEDGLEIRNGYRRHSIAWSEVRGLSMASGAPWPTLIHGDDERTMLFALQRADGPRTAKAVEELVRRIGPSS